MVARMLVRVVASAATASAVLLTAGAAQAAPVADYQLPFACHQEWTGTTRTSHSPSPNAIDFNGLEDLGKPVLAAESGVVTAATDLGRSSYGRYIKIAHGNDESTLYAHLDTMYVVAGQRVDQGQLIGTVGTSGGSTGPHLHFEERRGSSVVVPYFDGVAYRMPQTSASRNCVNVPVAGDWNNDGSDNLGVFERQERGFFLKKTKASTVRTQVGRGIDSPFVGDWDGDGTTDLGVRRKLTGRFVLRTSAGTVDRSIVLGGPGDIGVAGDWNGDGLTEVGIWRPRTTDFLVRRASGVIQTVDLGTLSSLPVTGDFDGDGRTDVGVYDSATATWSLRHREGRGWGHATSVKAGLTYELPVTGDWNGDGVTDLATWNRETGAWTRRVVDSGAARTTTRYFGAQG